MNCYAIKYTLCYGPGMQSLCNWEQGDTSSYNLTAIDCRELTDAHVLRPLHRLHGNLVLLMFCDAVPLSNLSRMVGLFILSFCNSVINEQLETTTIINPQPK